jgi:glycerophosphoryl diester phosphodiesterase
MKPWGLLLAGLACLAVAAPAAPPLQPVTIVAHRGLTEGMPENTIAAFRRAAERGVPVVELDVRVTRDGQLAIMHDTTVDRTTNGTGRVAAMTLATIQALDAGGPDHPGEGVPTLADALEAMGGKGTRLLLDIKPGTPLEKVIGLVRKHHAEASAIFGLRRAKDVARVRHELPASTALSFMATPGDAAAHASAGTQIIRLWSDWVEADPSLVRRTQALGPQVWILVGRHLPRSDREWRALHARMIATGAEGLVTDRPELASPSP